MHQRSDSLHVHDDFQSFSRPGSLHIEDDDGDDGDVDDPLQNVHDDFQPLSRPSPTAPSRTTSLTSALRGHFRYALGMMITLLMVVLKRMMVIALVVLKKRIMIMVVVMMMIVDNGERRPS